MDTLSPGQRSELMAKVRAVDTHPEIAVRKLVSRLGYRYHLHRKNLPGTPDLVFSGLKKVIFVHGCFWHQHHCPEGQRRPKSKKAFWAQKLESNIRRDRHQLLTLRRLGWHVLVIWECQTRAKHLENLAVRIQRFLDKQT